MGQSYTNWIFPFGDETFHNLPIYRWLSHWNLHRALSIIPFDYRRVTQRNVIFHDSTGSGKIVKVDEWESPGPFLRALSDFTLVAGCPALIQWIGLRENLQNLQETVCFLMKYMGLSCNCSPIETCWIRWTNYNDITKNGSESMNFADLMPEQGSQMTGTEREILNVYINLSFHQSQYEYMHCMTC